MAIRTKPSFVRIHTNRSCAWTYPANLSQEVGAQTFAIFGNLKPVNARDGTSPYLAHCQSSGANGVSFRDTAVSHVHALGFFADSSGTPYAPNAQVSFTWPNTRAMIFIAASWDGGLSASGINLYSAVDDDFNLTKHTPTSTVDGTGSINGSSEQPIGICGWGDATTTISDNRVAYAARWSYKLSDDEVQKVLRLGPLSVRKGLIFCLMRTDAIGRDMGPYSLSPSKCLIPLSGFSVDRPLGTGVSFFYGQKIRVHSSRQFSAPIADISNNGWTPSTGADRYATIDEAAPPNFSDYDFSPTNPTGQSFRVKVASVNDPLTSGGHLWRYALRATAQDTLFTIKVFVNTTELDSWTELVLAGEGDVIRFHQLSGAVADAITDYADVRVDISATAP